MAQNIILKRKNTCQVLVCLRSQCLLLRYGALSHFMLIISPESTNHAIISPQSHDCGNHSLFVWLVRDHPAVTSPWLSIEWIVCFGRSRLISVRANVASLKQWTEWARTGKPYVQAAGTSGTRLRAGVMQGTRILPLCSISARRETCLGIRFYASGNIRNHVTNDLWAKTVQRNIYWYNLQRNVVCGHILSNR